MLPLTIIDVGALGGVHEKWKHMNYRAVLFEPNPQAHFLNKENWLVLPVALSDSAGRRTLYITKKNSKSSFLEPNFDLIYRFGNPGRFDVVATAEVETDTLDNQLKRNDVRDVDLIKLDVQGHELPILKGGVDSLAKAVAVELEVEFFPIYKGASLFGDIDMFLRKHDFELMRLTHLEPWKCDGRERLIWGEALYVKNPETLSEQKRARLELIQAVVAPKMKGVWSVVKFKKAIKGYIKNLLAQVGLLHPALGVKTDGGAKAGALLRNKRSDIDTLVETGTNTGETLRRIGHYFKKVYSIELDSELYERAQTLFAHQENITLLCGDSATELQKVLAGLSGPALFWLDAHPSGIITAQTAPIIDELKAIFSSVIRTHVILIDDARLFSRATIAEVRQLAKTNGYSVEIKDGLFWLQPSSGGL